MAPLDRDRLAKVLALLASPYPGEVAVAAKTALDLLNAAEMTWTEVMNTPAADHRAELLQEKIVTLKVSNSRLRAEIRAIQAKGKYLSPSARTQFKIPRALSTWILIAFAFELLLLISLS
jgi:hypothetical protein